jgi:hypothetical protein
VAIFDRVFLATLTRTTDDAGTDAGRLNVTINVQGEDQLDRDFGFLTGSGLLSSGLGPDSGWLDDGQAALSDELIDPPIESNDLTHSSIRIGIRSDDAWSPEHVLLLGSVGSRVIALAMETEISKWLSTDSGEGHLTMPVRLVSAGSDTTLIQRLLLLVYTSSGDDVQTDSPIELQAAVSGQLVVQQQIPDTPQDDEEQYTANWYFIPVLAPFTRGGLRTKGSMRLSILGTDAWTPDRVFVYGLDTETGRPNTVVDLVTISEWTLGNLSTDSSEGQASVPLPVN